MNYHVPLLGRIPIDIPLFAERNGELISPEKIYSSDEYPTLPCTMVKIVGRNGRRIFIPIHKVKAMEV